MHGLKNFKLLKKQSHSIEIIEYPKHQLSNQRLGINGQVLTINCFFFSQLYLMVEVKKSWDGDRKSGTW